MVILQCYWFIYKKDCYPLFSSCILIGYLFLSSSHTVILLYFIKLLYCVINFDKICWKHINCIWEKITSFDGSKEFNSWIFVAWFLLHSSHSWGWLISEDCPVYRPNEKNHSCKLKGKLFYNFKFGLSSV